MNFYMKVIYHIMQSTLNKVGIGKRHRHQLFVAKFHAAGIITKGVKGQRTEPTLT